MSPSKTKQSPHLWFIRILGNYSPLTHLLCMFALSIVALSRSDSSHYYGFASKGNPGFLQHSSGQSPGLTVPATVHTRRSRSLLNACLHVICMRSEIPVDTVVVLPVCPVKAFRLNNRSVHVMLLINRKQDRTRKPDLSDAEFSQNKFLHSRLCIHLFMRNFLSCSDGRSSAIS